MPVVGGPGGALCLLSSLVGPTSLTALLLSRWSSVGAAHFSGLCSSHDESIDPTLWSSFINVYAAVLYSTSSGSRPAQSAGTPCSVTAILPVARLCYRCCFRSVISNLHDYFMGFDREKTHACRWGFDRINLATGASRQQLQQIKLEWLNDARGCCVPDSAKLYRCLQHSPGQSAPSSAGGSANVPAFRLRCLISIPPPVLLCIDGLTVLMLLCPAAHSVKVAKLPRDALHRVV